MYKGHPNKKVKMIEIAAADTFTSPNTMMVKILDADVAIVTMLNSINLFGLAKWTISRS